LASSIAFAQEARVFFSPQGGCEQAIITQLAKAKMSADIAMYNLTSEPIAQEIARLKKRGVAVRIFLDKSQKGQKASQAGFLKGQGISVRIHQGSGLMHHKFAIIDRKTLLTGSFNWTENAEEDNAENLLVLSDKKLISQYAKEFESLWHQGREADIRRDFNKLTSDCVKFLLKLFRAFF
jgi:phosphatidylserine/phosphatidylglycerophosphate/cardiolipin synthase-like enzyme